MTREEFWCIVSFRVRYSEADQQGLLFNSHYLAYFDTAIVEYFRALPYELVSSKDPEFDFHVVRALVEYKRPIHFDDEVDVAIRITRLGRSSMTFGIGIFGKDNNELCATGEVVWVNTDQRTRTAVPIPQRLRAVVEERESNWAGRNDLYDPLRFGDAGQRV